MTVFPVRKRPHGGEEKRHCLARGKSPLVFPRRRGKKRAETCPTRGGSYFIRKNKSQKREAGLWSATKFAKKKESFQQKWSRQGNTGEHRKNIAFLPYFRKKSKLGRIPR